MKPVNKHNFTKDRIYNTATTSSGWLANAQFQKIPYILKNKTKKTFDKDQNYVRLHVKNCVN